jgi:hypothetical protein
MPADPRIFPFVLALLAVWLVYRRLRRTFGRQRVRPSRMIARLALLLIVGSSLLPAAFGAGRVAIADLVGLAAGVTLGVWGYGRTRFAMYEDRLHYIPHTYTGIAVSSLFIGRLVYRVVELAAANHPAAMDHIGGYSTQGVPSPEMMRSPFTGGSLFLVVGYYLFYYSAVLWKSKRISPEDLEGTVASMPTPPKGEGAASG